MTAEFDEIEEEIRKVISKELKVPVGEVKKESTIADLGGDSLAALQLLAVIEAHFNISIPNDEAINIQSFKAIAGSVKKHLKS